ncbi:Phosphoheptose isomerase [uncultured archaeon]|nr:Phosphoheptose isomerase [uncultured archaeon]
MSEKEIKAQIAESIRTKQAVADKLTPQIKKAANLITNTLKKGNKILLIGNGGSAADAQHIAAEFVGRYLKERTAWPAISLATDTSALTALTNDYGGQTIFSRQIEALGQKGDLLIALSTSGRSPNILKACETARKKKMKIIGLTGAKGTKLKNKSDITLMVPSTETPRIQESHITIGHILASLVENELTK